MINLVIVLEAKTSIPRIIMVFFGLLVPLLLKSILLQDRKESYNSNLTTGTTPLVTDPAFEEKPLQDHLEVQRGLNNTAQQSDIRSWIAQGLANIHI